MPDFSSMRRGIKYILRLTFENVIWWWQFTCSEKWIPGSLTNFGWVIKIRSIHDEKSPIMFVGSLIICSNPDWWIKPPILDRSWYEITNTHTHTHTHTHTQIHIYIYICTPKACNFIKKETPAQVFSCEFCEISKKTFLQNTLGDCFWKSWRLTNW